MSFIVSCGRKKVDKIYFAWRLTNWCNYKCSYCPNLRIITDDYKTDEHAIYHKLVLARLKTVETPFTICLTGGEPTLYPGIHDVMRGLTEIGMCENAVLMTNLSRPAAFYQQFDDIGSDKAVIMSSAHPEYVNEELFVAKSIVLSKFKHARYTAHINLMSDPNTWALSKRIMDRLLSEGVAVRPNILSDTQDSRQNYTQQFYDVFEEYLQNTKGELIQDIDCVMDDGTSVTMKDYEVERAGLNNFKGYTCTPLAFKITMEGVVQNSCTERIMSLSLANDNIIKQETCPHDVCAGRQLLTYYKHK